MISKNLDTMLQQMEQSTDKEWAIEAEVARFDANEWAKKHACFRCQNANWMAGPADEIRATAAQKNPEKKFTWSLSLGGCRAFQPVTIDQFPVAPFFCSSEKNDDAALGSQPVPKPGGLPAAGAGLAERFVQRPRGQAE